MIASTSRMLLGLAAALAFAGCGPATEVVEYCAELCDCEDCNDVELEECEIRAQRNLDIAENQGCDDDYLAFLDCAARKNDCESLDGNDYFFWEDSCEDDFDDYADCRDDRIIDPF